MATSPGSDQLELNTRLTFRAVMQKGYHWAAVGIQIARSPRWRYRYQRAAGAVSEGADIFHWVAYGRFCVPLGEVGGRLVDEHH